MGRALSPGGYEASRRAGGGAPLRAPGGLASAGFPTTVGGGGFRDLGFRV